MADPAPQATLTEEALRDLESALRAAGPGAYLANCALEMALVAHAPALLATARVARTLVGALEGLTDALSLKRAEENTVAWQIKRTMALPRALAALDEARRLGLLP